jgi:hypothetical protein
MDQQTLSRAIEANQELKKITEFFAESSKGRKVSIVQRAKQMFLKAERIGLYQTNVEIAVSGKEREAVLNILKNRELEIKKYISEL